MPIKGYIMQKWISSAGADHLYKIMLFVIRRFSQLNPNDELVIMSLAKYDSEKRERQIKEMAAFLLSQTHSHPETQE